MFRNSIVLVIISHDDTCVSKMLTIDRQLIQYVSDSVAGSSIITCWLTRKCLSHYAIEWYGRGHCFTSSHFKLVQDTRYNLFPSYFIKQNNNKKTNKRSALSEYSNPHSARFPEIRVLKGHIHPFQTHIASIAVWNIHRSNWPSRLSHRQIIISALMVLWIVSFIQNVERRGTLLLTCSKILL